VIGGAAKGRHVNQDGAARLPVADENVGRNEGHRMAVGADGRIEDTPTDLVAVIIYTYADGSAQPAVAHKNVANAVGIPRDQVGGIRVESHVAPIVTRGGPTASIVALRATAGKADAGHSRTG